MYQSNLIIAISEYNTIVTWNRATNVAVPIDITDEHSIINNGLGSDEKD